MPSLGLPESLGAELDERGRAGTEFISPLGYSFYRLGSKKSWDFCIKPGWPVCLVLSVPVLRVYAVKLHRNELLYGMRVSRPAALTLFSVRWVTETELSLYSERSHPQQSLAAV